MKYTITFLRRTCLFLLTLIIVLIPALILKRRIARHDTSKALSDETSLVFAQTTDRNGSKDRPEMICEYAPPENPAKEKDKKEVPPDVEIPPEALETIPTPPPSPRNSSPDEIRKKLEEFLKKHPRKEMSGPSEDTGDSTMICEYAPKEPDPQEIPEPSKEKTTDHPN